MRRAFSLVELIVYAGLALVVSFAALSLLTLGRQAGNTAALSYSLGRDVDTAVRTIREDLRSTSINSVRISYNPPGLSFVSALDEGSLTMSHQGVPGWRKYVYYVLDYKPGATTGNLVRWEQEARIDAPAVSATPVGPVGSRSSRVLLRNVVVPGGSSPAGPADKQSGGLVVRFVRTYSDGTEELSDRSPVDFSRDGGSGGNPRPYPYPPPRTAPIFIVSVDFANHKFYFKGSSSSGESNEVKGASNEDLAWASAMLAWQQGDRKADPPQVTVTIMNMLAASRVERGWTEQDAINWQSFKREYDRWAGEKAAWDRKEAEDAAKSASKAIDGNTPLLEVRLTAVDASQNANAPNCSSLKFRVRCRY